MWFKIRNNKIGCKFKRQYSIGGYILDFYCSEFKLIIEIDAASHNTQEAKEYYENRDRYFKELSYTTIRFLNSEIENKIEHVLVKIKSYLICPSPSQGEGQG